MRIKYTLNDLTTERPYIKPEKCPLNKDRCIELVPTIKKYNIDETLNFAKNSIDTCCQYLDWMDEDAGIFKCTYPNSMEFINE